MLLSTEVSILHSAESHGMKIYWKANRKIQYRESMKRGRVAKKGLRQKPRTTAGRLRGVRLRTDSSVDRGHNVRAKINNRRFQPGWPACRDSKARLLCRDIGQRPLRGAARRVPTH